MKKNFLTTAVIIFAAVFLCSAAAAEGYINANDLDTGTIVQTQTYEDDFVITARSDKSVVIDDAADGRTAADGEMFTRRIKLGGTGEAGFRSVQFPAKASEKVTIYMNSSSATDARMLILANKAGDVITTITAPADVKGELKAGMATVTIPATGEYILYSKSGGINIYQVTVKAQ